MNTQNENTIPVHTALDRSHSKPNGFVSILASVAPILIIILVTKPALRQSIKLRSAHTLFRFCDWQTETWKNATMSSARIYENAKL